MYIISHSPQNVKHSEKKYKDDEIYFICGTDNLNYIDKWKKGNYILSNYKILVIERESNDIKELLEKYKEYKDNIIGANIKKSKVSSTKIRKMIYNNKRVNKYLDKEVYLYIKNNNLYTRRI